MKVKSSSKIMPENVCQKSVQKLFSTPSSTLGEWRILTVFAWNASELWRPKKVSFQVVSASFDFRTPWFSAVFKDLYNGFIYCDIMNWNVFAISFELENT